MPISRQEDQEAMDKKLNEAILLNRGLTPTSSSRTTTNSDAASSNTVAAASNSNSDFDNINPVTLKRSTCETGTITESTALPTRITSSSISTFHASDHANVFNLLQRAPSLVPRARPAPVQPLLTYIAVDAEIKDARSSQDIVAISPPAYFQVCRDTAFDLFPSM